MSGTQADQAKAPSSALPPITDTGNASWQFADTALLISELFQRKAQAGDGGSFKATVWNEVSVILTASRTAGGPKTAKSCQAKWGSLRTTFRHVEAAMSHSGWVWVHGKGANITGDQKNAWDLFIKTHKEAAPYRNKDFPHYDAIAQIVPSSISDKNVFTPSAPLPLAENVSAPSAPPPPPEEPDDAPLTSDDPIPVTSSPARVPATSATAIAAARKRERAAVTTPPNKRSKLTGPAAALQGITKSIDAFGDKMCAALAMDPELRTPHRRKQALQRCQKETWLSLPDRLVLYGILEKDPNAVDAYTSIDPDNKEFLEMWVAQKLDDTRGVGGSLL